MVAMTTTETSIPEWTLGWRLQRSLDYADVSVTEMGDYLGLSRSQLSRYLHDKGPAPRPGVLRSWALRCGVPYEWLRTGEVEPDTTPTQGDAQSRWMKRGTSRHGTRHLTAA